MSATQAALHAEAILADFPILAQRNARGQRLVYLDSASSSQKPQQVLEVLEDYYRRYNANIHRGVYGLSELASSGYETARQQVATFLNAASPRECIFVRSTTEAINLVAQSWGRQNIQPGDLIVNTVLDHHANLVPWQQVARERGAEVAYVQLNEDGQLDLEQYIALLAREPKLVAFSHVSNALGTVNDARLLTRMAKAAGATVLVDAAQSAPHRAIDVQSLQCDFLAFSGHKTLAPMGSGVLYGRLKLLQEMPPFMTGGGMIASVTLQETTWADVPAKFEAGTPAVGEAIGLGAATTYLRDLGLERVAAHEEHLAEMARAGLAEIDGVQLYGPSAVQARSGIVGFTLHGAHPVDVAVLLDSEHIAVRAGRHCCHPLFDALGVEAMIRASFYLYNTEEDVARLLAGVAQAQRTLRQRPATAPLHRGEACSARLTA